MAVLLYHPTVNPPKEILHQALLYWDGIASVVPRAPERDVRGRHRTAATPGPLEPFTGRRRDPARAAWPPPVGQDRQLCGHRDHGVERRAGLLPAARTALRPGPPLPPWAGRSAAAVAWLRLIPCMWFLP